MKKFRILVLSLLLVSLLSACQTPTSTPAIPENTPTESESTPKTAKDLTDGEAESLALSALAKNLPLEPYADAEIGAQMGLLLELKLSESEPLETLLQGIGDVTTYVKTDVKYADFKALMLERMTEKRFARFAHYTDMDGYVGITAAAIGYTPITVQEAKLLSRDEDTFTFTLRMRDEGLYSHYEYPEPGETVTEEECYFSASATCVYKDGVMLLDSITYK